MSESHSEKPSGIASFGVGFGSGPTPDLPAETPAEAGTFRIGVVSALTPRPELATASAGPRHARLVDAANLDEVMTALAVELTIEITNPHDLRGKPLAVELRFAKLRDFRPDTLAQQVPLLRSLRAAPGEPAPAPRPASAAPAEPKSLLESLLDDDGAGDVTSAAASSGSGAPSASAQAAFTRALGEVLAHPEVRRLERAWRGLKWLVDRVGVGAGARASVQVVAADVDEVEAALDALALGDQPVGLLLVDHVLGATPRDLARMGAWAQRAEAIGAPLVANTGPEVLGFDDLAALARTQRRLRSSDDPRAAALRSVAARDSARWLSLAANGPLGRARYTGDSARIGAPFEEPDELFVGAAWAVGALAAQSFARSGWPCALTGTREGRLTSLHVHMGADRGEPVSIALEALMREDVAAEAAGAGVTLLCCPANQDLAFLPSAPMLFRGPVGASGTSAAASTTLGDQLFVARVGQAVLQLAAAIPRGTPPAAAAEVARVVLEELFAGQGGARPELELAIQGEPPTLELTVRPRGFLGLRLEEATLGARLG